MGTRHSQMVINVEGETKLRQYGQWDGYPSGQGIAILEWLRTANLEKYLEEVNKLRQPTKKEEVEIDNLKDWEKVYPYLSRNCGSKIHKMIEDGEVEFVYLQDKKDALSWCEGFYTIDFSKNLFIAEYYDTTKRYRLNDLPSNKKFLKHFKD